MTNKAVLDSVDSRSAVSHQKDTDSKSSVYRQQLRHPAWQLCMLILSIYALASLSLEALVITDPEISKVLVTVDFMICLVFLTDFLYLFFTASSKRSYMLRWGWIDLISSIPIADPLRWGRLARVVRIISILRAVKSIRVIGDTIRVSPFETLSVMTFVIVFVSISVSAGLILEFERGFESQLKSSSDALWWSFLSVMNAKGGFQLPVSPEGILTTVYLNKVGLLLFAYINGSVVAWLVSNRRSTPSVVEE